MDVIELKKWSVEQAMQRETGASMIDTAEKIFYFLVNHMAPDFVDSRATHQAGVVDTSTGQTDIEEFLAAADKKKQEDEEFAEGAQWPKKPKKERKSLKGQALTGKMQAMLDAINEMDEQEPEAKITYAAIGAKMGIGTDKNAIMAVGRTCYNLKMRELITIDGKGPDSHVQLAPDDEEGQQESSSTENPVEDEESDEDSTNAARRAADEEETEEEIQPPKAVPPPVRRESAPYVARNVPIDSAALDHIVGRYLIEPSRLTSIGNVAHTLKIKEDLAWETCRRLRDNGYLEIYEDKTMRPLKNKNGGDIPWKTGV